MAEIKLPDIRPAKTIEEKLDALYDAYFVMRKFMTYYLSGNLDEENVVRAQEAVIANILAGTIKADQIDVTEGKIQAAQIVDLVVGENVIMGPNARISWSQVTGAPSIPTLPGYIKSTYIDATTVQSPTIVGGTISGMHIYGSEFHGEGANSAYIKVGSSSGLGDIRLYRGGTSTPVFWIYDGIDGISFMSNLGNGSQTAFLMSTGTATYAYGTWNFSGATVTGLSAVAVFG